jgi:DNA invertase Pin-like site-specific DNA recombinase/predicted RNA-binding Zn-ribbon protein involved in translation (DUF1610 family)
LAEAPIRAAGYVRVSTERQAEEGLSLEAQERRVRDYIDREGWTLDTLYIERGVSGRREGRPELDRLLASLDSINRLVIPKLDRLGRSNRHLHEVAALLQAADVDLVAVDGSINTTTANGRLMFGMFATLAQFESDTIGERVRSVSAARVEQGKHHGRAPYGYESKDGELVPKEPESSVVRRIFEDFASGLRQRALARALNAEGIKTQRGSAWVQGTISGLLRNATYVGRVAIHGQEYEASHTPLVSAETWERAHKLLAATARTKGRGRGRPSSGSHLFTRDLRLTCGHCGESMIPRTNRDRRAGKTYEVYKCFGRDNHGPESCPMLPIPRVELDSAVFDYFESVALDLDAMREELREAAGDKTREVRELLTQARRDEREAAAAITKAKRDYGRDALTAEVYSELAEDYRAEHEAAQAKLTRLEAREAEVAAALSAVDDSDGDAVRRLREIRAAVAGEVRSAEGLDAVRAALSRMFDGFTVARPVVGNLDDLPPVERAIVVQQDKALDRAMGEDGGTVLAVGTWEVIPWARDEIVAGVDEAWKPILRRESMPVGARTLMPLA